MGSDDVGGESAPTYDALADSLSQGDLVYSVPPVVIEHPLIVCRPDNRPGRAWTAPATEARNAFAKGLETIHANSRAAGIGMVIWEDCQIDKFKNQGIPPNKWFVGVAPVLPITAVESESARANVREGRRLAFFPLPAMPSIGLKVDHYVDLRFIVPVRHAMLEQRVIALSPAAKRALHMHLFKFLTAKMFIDRLNCPQCGHLMLPEQLMLRLED